MRPLPKKKPIKKGGGGGGKRRKKGRKKEILVSCRKQAARISSKSVARKSTPIQKQKTLQIFFLRRERLSCGITLTLLRLTTPVGVVPHC